MIDLAYAMGSSPAAGSGGPGALLIQMAPIVLVLGIFFFLVIRPQQRERQKREAMLQSLKKGDRVVTSGGLIGTVVTVNEQTLTLKIADSVRVECLRSAITGFRDEAKGASDSA